MVVTQGKSTLAHPKISKKNLRDDVYTIVLNALMGGQYAPGEHLAIDRVARELGVSPTPVREALAHLERTGLVERVALRGYRVAQPLSQEQIRQLIDIRTVLEVAAAERANGANGLVPELAKAHQRHREEAFKLEKRARQKVLEPEDFYAYFDADWDFHQVIFDHCGNAYMSKMLQDLAFNTHRMRQSVAHNDSDGLIAVQEHEMMLRAFESGDVDKVRQAVHAHLDGVLERSLGDAQEERLPRP
ncbi:MAG: GntR family transcriptional regulator [Arcanobacterium sp.]|nr:GntR family transcriptional regulator [Arcanobacterium sp.]